MIVAILFIVAGLLGALPVPNGTQIAWALVAIAGVFMVLPGAL